MLVGELLAMSATDELADQIGHGHSFALGKLLDHATFVLRDEHAQVVLTSER